VRGWAYPVVLWPKEFLGGSRSVLGSRTASCFAERHGEGSLRDSGGQMSSSWIGSEEAGLRAKRLLLLVVVVALILLR